MQVKIVSNDKQYEEALMVRRKVFIEEQHVPEELELDEHEESAEHFIAYSEEQPVGAGRCRIVENYCKVERICVVPLLRRQGVGEAIMRTIEEYARKRDLEGLKLNSQTHAKKFYTRLGYEIYSDEFLDAGIPHVAMIRKF